MKSLHKKRIGILGKGGSGKSTITVLLSKIFAKQGYTVVVLDADSTNIGLYKALGFKKAPRSMMEYFGGTTFGGGLVTCPVDDPTFLPKAKISLEKISCAYYVKNQQGILLFVLGKIGDKGPGSGCDGPISKITRDLTISDAGDNVITLIDLKAGLEDSARGVITSLDGIITVVDPTNAAIQIAKDIQVTINQIKEGVPPSTDHLKDIALVNVAREMFRKAKIKDSFVILNKIDNQNTEKYLKDALKNLKILGTLPKDPIITSAWLRGTVLKETFFHDALREIIANLEMEFKEN
jgi:CO dehydrogenase nickel-insertion accessory protein CooC1